MNEVARENCKFCNSLTSFQIDDSATLLRDAKCKCCKASLRSSDVMDCIIHTFNNNLVDLRILNTSSSGAIHQKLCNLKGYVASEYYKDVPANQRKRSVTDVDLTSIPWKENSFDLIISEDVLEHVENYKKAFKEIHRVLSPGGYHIFTVPVHEGRATKSRSQNRNIVHHGDPLRQQGAVVQTDFGDDLPEILKEFGFETEMYIAHEFYSPDQITDVDKTYQEYLSKRNRMDHYFKYNSIVFISKTIKE